MSKRNELFLGGCNKLEYATGIPRQIYRIGFIVSIFVNSFVAIVFYFIFSAILSYPKDYDNDA